MPAFMVSAPGKVIVHGEHAVVYGQPAIAVPFTALSATARSTRLPPGAGLVIDARDLNQLLRVDSQAIENALVYSASGSWTVDYCLGMLINSSGDLLNRAAWQKRGPVFQKTEQMWGVGHCSFVQTPST